MAQKRKTNNARTRRKTVAKRTSTRSRSKSTNRRKVSSSRSSSSLLTNPLSITQNKRLLVALIVGVGIIAAFFIYRANAQEFTAVVATGFEENCTNNVGTRSTERSLSSLKREFSICTIKSGSELSPVLYHYSRGNEGTYTTVINQMKSKGYNRVRTCAYLSSTNGTATVELSGLGKEGTKKTVNPTTADYQEFCTTQSIEGANQNAKIKVISGTVKASSMIMQGRVVVAPPSGNDPVAVTLNNSNTGPRNSRCSNGYRNASGTFGQSGGTLYIENDTTYSCYSVSAVIARSGGKGATLRDSKISGGSSYTVNTTGSGYKVPNDLRMEYVTIHNTSDGKAILGGGFTLYRSRVSGGEDAVHLNASADTLIRESIIEEVNYPAGSHSDAIQLTSGGSGGTLTVEDSILQVGYKQQNAGLQVNVTSGNIYSSRNWYHGGAYSILGDPGNKVISRNDMFAYDTAQFGTNGGVPTDRQGAVWWSRQVRPRKSTPYATPSGEAPGFPGNGVPVSQNSPY